MVLLARRRVARLVVIPSQNHKAPVVCMYVAYIIAYYVVLYRYYYYIHDTSRYTT